jgi:hypothetical protein
MNRHAPKVPEGHFWKHPPFMDCPGCSGVNPDPLEDYADPIPVARG